MWEKMRKFPIYAQHIYGSCSVFNEKGLTNKKDQTGTDPSVSQYIYVHIRKIAKKYYICDENILKMQIKFLHICTCGETG